MAILTVGGVDIPLASGVVRNTIREIGGERAEMFAGNTVSTVRARKDGWQSLPTRLLASAERDAIKAVLVATPPVSCSGDLLGGTVDMIPVLESIESQRTTAGIRWRITFSLLEA